MNVSVQGCNGITNAETHNIGITNADIHNIGITNADERRTENGESDFQFLIPNS